MATPELLDLSRQSDRSDPEQVQESDGYAGLLDLSRQSDLQLCTQHLSLWFAANHCATECMILHNFNTD